MKINEVIKERIRIELEQFKMFIVLIIPLSGGLYALMLNLEGNKINQNILILGFVFFIFLFCVLIKSLIKIKKLSKKLEEPNNNHV